MLTARGEEIDRVVGLELGADDYVVKPFSRRRAHRPHPGDHAARPRAPNADGPIDVGPLTLDPVSRTVTKGGDPIELAAKEFDLLHLLMANAGRGAARASSIMDEVWDPHWFGPTKTLDVHISWLRKKIEDDPSNPRLHHHRPRRRLPVPAHDRPRPSRRSRRRPRRSARGSSWPSPTSSWSC